MTTKIDVEEQLADLHAFLASAVPELAAGAQLAMQVNDFNCTIGGEVALQLLAKLTGDEQAARDADEVLTTGQVADLLGVSRPTVVALVDEGRIEAVRVGTHRRIRRRDALAYLDASRVTRSDALDELTRLSQELGLYDAS